MLVPLNRTAIIIDHMAFRRARVESFLNSWAKIENVQIISLQPERARAIVVEEGCDLLIYDVGGTYLTSCEMIAEINAFHNLCPRAALVILADDQGAVALGEMLNSGVCGYLSDSMPPDLALHALSFILRGGTYFPPTAILTSKRMNESSVSEFTQPGIKDLLRSSPIHAVPQLGDVAFARVEHNSLRTQHSMPDLPSDGIQRRDELPAIDSAPLQFDNSLPLLTDRQQAILRCICRGESNKAIARAFEIAEGTVKIHVKTILRKVGVKNRTQAAIWALQNGFSTTPDSSSLV